MAFLSLGAAALLPVAAAAFPDGAPWDALDNPDEGCVSCHLGADPVMQSAALSVEGLDGPLSPGETYAIALRFTAEEAEQLGFLAVFEPAQGSRIVVSEGLEAHGAAVRSTVTASSLSQGAAWSFDWTVPETPGPVVLRIAGVAANDDASPLGDVVHLKTLSFDTGREP